MERLIASPMPLPCGLVVTKALKISSALSAGNPTPVSLTEILAAADSAVIRISTYVTSCRHAQRFKGRQSPPMRSMFMELRICASALTLFPDNLKALASRYAEAFGLTRFNWGRNTKCLQQECMTTNSL
jgi:hypothetical protein